MKILLDMNLSPLWVRFLADHEIEATHWSSLGPATATDSEILDFAVVNSFVVFTHDLDFGALLAASNAGGPSIIQVRTNDVLPPGIGSIVLDAIEKAKPYLDAGAIVTVDDARARIRVLPLR
jgi:predicted nuclease of predicted toxin-antitoxin system